MTKILSILGPTASGKTALGLELAERLGGEIVSVDSMQVYRGMDVGTAKASPEERERVPHHLIDILDPDQAYNAGRFVEDAQEAISLIRERGRLPILLGGTALYLRSLIHGMIEAPEANPELKQELWEELDRKGVAALFSRLLKIDPKAAGKLNPMDQARILRALEVKLETGESILDWQERHRSEPRYEVFSLGRLWPREVLYDRINRRSLQMIEEGLVSEVEGLLELGYGPRLPSMRAIGYKQAVAHLQGEMSQEEMIRLIQQDTRRYAKKQLTWYRKWSPIHWLVEESPLEELMPSIERFLAP